MEDMLIVGGGLAGSILAMEAGNRGLSFKWVVYNDIPSASAAAYGMCNPVHYHNMVPAWKASELFEPSRSFFLNCAERSGVSFYRDVSVHHLITDENELIQWRQNVESTSLWKYTDGELSLQILPLLKTGFLGSIPLKGSFFIDIPAFIKSTREVFKKNIFNTEFKNTHLELDSDHCRYGEYRFSKVIFATGSYAGSDAFFSQVPFNPCKGQMLVLKIKGLELNEAIHKKIVLLPLGNEQFICGATYEWDELDFNVTEKGKEELLCSLRNILNDKYQIETVDHKAGVRPTISDRRPVVGWHPVYNNIGILNGFGTRGLMVGPSCAINLLNNFQTGEPVLSDWDVNRFKKRLLKK